MNLIYRRLTINDLDTFINMRINQLQEEGAKPIFDLKPQLLEYYTKHLQDGTFVSWIATDNNKIVARLIIKYVYFKRVQKIRYSQRTFNQSSQRC